MCLHSQDMSTNLNQESSSCLGSKIIGLVSWLQVVIAWHHGSFRRENRLVVIDPLETCTTECRFLPGVAFISNREVI